MWAAHLAEDGAISNHLQENAEAVKKGLEIMTENVLTLVRGCKRAGVDGFYASSQGGEAFRFQDPSIFQKYIKPTDLAVWDEISSCSFNILHICDYEGSYDDLTPFLDYPGHVVNSSLKVGDHTLTPKEASQLFGRPFMGGMERKGVLATGDPEVIRQTVTDVLEQTPERFILAADCTVPSDTSWDNLRTAIETAHQYRKH
jgi:uroporphyrinogen decarboxylase